MRRFNFIVWLALVLVCSKLECASACAIANCAGSAPPGLAHHFPPCHRHHNPNSGDPTHALPCAQQLAVLNIPPDRASGHDFPMAFLWSADIPVVAHYALAPADRNVQYQTVPPPNLPGISSVILRV